MSLSSPEALERCPENLPHEVSHKPRAFSQGAKLSISMPVKLLSVKIGGGGPGWRVFIELIVV